MVFLRIPIDGELKEGDEAHKENRSDSAVGAHESEIVCVKLLSGRRCCLLFLLLLIVIIIDIIVWWNGNTIVAGIACTASRSR